MKTTATFGEANYSRNTINIRSSRDNSASWMSSAAGPPEFVGKQQHQGQYQQQVLTSRTLATVGWTAAGTILTSQTEAAEGRPAKTEMPATAVMLSTVIALAGPPIAAWRCQSQ